MKVLEISTPQVFQGRYELEGMVGRGYLGCGNTEDPRASSLFTVSVDMCGASEPELPILKQTAKESCSYGTPPLPTPYWLQEEGLTLLLLCESLGIQVWQQGIRTAQASLQHPQLQKAEGQEDASTQPFTHLTQKSALPTRSRRTPE